MPDLFGYDLEAVTLERFRVFEPPEGFYLAYGGGKDSVVLLDLAQRAGVRFDAHHHYTSIEPPELQSFVRSRAGVTVDRSGVSYFSLLVRRGFPTRQHRWCCREFRERYGSGRFVLTGVRRAESARRRGRGMVELCRAGHGKPGNGGKRFLSPLIDWTDSDVWGYIARRRLDVCRLYGEGFKRVGCIACPMQTAAERRRQLARWPKYERAFRAAFGRLYDDRVRAGTWDLERWPSSDACFDWWVSNRGREVGESFVFD